MSPACRVIGRMLVVGAGVKASAYLITPVVFAVLLGLFVLCLLIQWLITPGPHH